MQLDEKKRDQLDIEVLTTSALRDGMTHAYGHSKLITYKQAFALGREVAPEIYLNVNRILSNPGESLGAQEMRQFALAQTRMEGREVTALEYLQGEIQKLKGQIDACDDGDDLHLLEKRLDKYRLIEREIRPRNNRENELILGDAIQAGLGLPEIYSGRNFKEYKLNPDRVLRVNVAHLTHIEDKIGCDLLYENLDYKKETARIVVIQYKTWEKDSLHYNEREHKQYLRMEGFACKGRLCDPDRINYQSYRLPNCTSFVRPTDRLQDPTSTIASSSLHIPVCVVQSAWVKNQNQGKSIRKELVNHRSLSHKTFGELFDNAMVGSREVSWEELAALYRSYGIFESDETVTVHMQCVENL